MCGLSRGGLSYMITYDGCNRGQRLQTLGTHGAPSVVPTRGMHDADSTGAGGIPTTELVCQSVCRSDCTPRALEPQDRTAIELARVLQTDAVSYSFDAEHGGSWKRTPGACLRPAMFLGASDSWSSTELACPVDQAVACSKNLKPSLGSSCAVPGTEGPRSLATGSALQDRPG